ncbi:MAG: hypothetical protein JO243_25210, partial [Solirubrobacterales bacterium]|nr:hypothetical protein [Solirubrobacterales bacterium]
APAGAAHVPAGVGQALAGAAHAPGGESQIPVAPPPPQPDAWQPAAKSASAGNGSLAERVAALETEVAALRAELDELRHAYG